MKIFQHSNMSQVMMYITYKKFLWSNSNFNFSKTANLVTSVQILWNFFWDVPVSKQRACLSIQNVLNFLPQHPHTISWPLDKFHGFQTLFEFYKILNHFYFMISIMHGEPNAKNLAPLCVHGLGDVSWTWRSFFQQLYSMISCTCNSYRRHTKNT
jgi:hypothetical protein